MTNEQRKLRVITSLVKDMWEKINEDNGYYVKDLSYEIEELASELELDTTFDSSEIIDLKKAGFKLSKDNQTATKLFKGTPVIVEKWNFSEYTLRFGKGRRKELEDNTDDLSDVKSTSFFFKELYYSYVDMMKG